jgi:hypothetical protein
MGADDDGAAAGKEEAVGRFSVYGFRCTGQTV